MKNVFFLFLITICLNTYAIKNVQKKDGEKKATKSIQKEDSVQQSNIIQAQINIPDKINIVSPKEPEPIWTPAIATLIAGILSVIANILVSWKLRTNATKNNDKQIERATDNLKLQLKTTTENIELQLNSSRSIKLTEIKSSINIGNRQEWMNEYRQAVSEFITLGATAAGKIGKPEDQVKILELKIRIELLLNPLRFFEDTAIALNDEFIQLIIDPNKEQTLKMAEVRVTMEKIVLCSRNILERNWKKINALEEA